MISRIQEGIWFSDGGKSRQNRKIVPVPNFSICLLSKICLDLVIDGPISQFESRFIIVCKNVNKRQKTQLVASQSSFDEAKSHKLTTVNFSLSLTEEERLILNFSSLCQPDSQVYQPTGERGNFVLYLVLYPLTLRSAVITKLF